MYVPHVCPPNSNSKLGWKGKDRVSSTVRVACGMDAKLLQSNNFIVAGGNPRRVIPHGGTNGMIDERIKVILTFTVIH